MDEQRGAKGTKAPGWRPKVPVRSAVPALGSARRMGSRAVSDDLATRRAPDARPSPDPSAPARLRACLAELTALHRHVCPRQVLGVRMGLYAGELLGLDLPRSDKRVLVFVETDGCLADSISVATGCWLGRRTLRLIDQGKTAATFVDTVTGRAIRIRPQPTARRRALDHAPDAPDRWHAQLDGYRIMPIAELLGAEPVTLALDLDAIRSSPGKRAVCAECGEDVMNEREVIRDGTAFCQACAGDRYYLPAG